jgi:hypothetical protein
MSFINALSTSNVPSYLIKWATRQVGFNQLITPVANTPQALLSMCRHGTTSLILSYALFSSVKWYMFYFRRVAC